MYGNPYGNPYIPNYAGMMQQALAAPMNPAPQMNIPRVNGEESAKAFSIGPNSSVILMDENNPLIWVVTTDASGYKNVTPFSIVPYTPEKPVTNADLQGQLGEITARLDKLEERINSDGQSNHGSAWKNKSGNSNGQSNGRNGQGGQGSYGGDSADVTK